MINVKDLCLIFFALASMYFGVQYYYYKRKFFSQRSFFINTLSHDFRVLLIAIIRGLQALSISDNYNREIRNNLTESAEFSFEILSMLLNTLNNNSKYYKSRPSDVSVLIKEECQNLSVKAIERDVQLKCETEESSADIDSSSISKTFGILLSMALANTVRCDTINCKVKHIGQKVITEIIYRGFPENQNKNFAEVGHDIKLFFCKKIIELHKGTLAIKNSGNCINSFTIILPATAKYC